LLYYNGKAADNLLYSILRDLGLGKKDSLFPCFLPIFVRNHGNLGEYDGQKIISILLNWFVLLDYGMGRRQQGK